LSISGYLNLKYNQHSGKEMSGIIYINKSKLISRLLICIFLTFSVAIHAQTDKKYIRKGNKEYNKDKFSESEILYRKAIDNNKQSPDAVFNTGDALYKQKKYEEACKQFAENVNLNEDKSKKSDGLYNLGNSLLQANKLKESIEAYKGALKLKPDNTAAKYNLAYAQDMLKQQEQQQQQNKDKQNQDKDKDKKNNKQDQKDNNKDKKDQQDQNKDQQNDQNKQDQQNPQQQQQEQGISKEDAERLLDAIANDEKNVQEKVKLEKAAKAKVRTVKNW
jgi:Ca-activated chloride channel homolog